MEIYIKDLFTKTEYYKFESPYLDLILERTKNQDLPEDTFSRYVVCLDAALTETVKRLKEYGLTEDSALKLIKSTRHYKVCLSPNNPVYFIQSDLYHANCIIDEIINK